MRSMVFSWSSIRARQAPWEAACVKPLSCGAGEGGARSAPGEGPALREERPHPPLRGTFSRTREKGVRSVVNHGADRLAVMHPVESLVDPFQRPGVGDVRVPVTLARHRLLAHARQFGSALDAARSEERRGGKACVS